MSAPKKQPGQVRVHKPVSPEAARVGRELREARGDRPRTVIAEQVPMSPQNLSNLEGGQYRLEDGRTQYRLMRLGEIYDKDFRLSFVREHLKQKRVTSASNLINFPDKQHARVSLIPVPIKGVISAGEPREAIEEDRGWIYMADTELVGIENPFALLVEGDSMSGLHILNGDLVIVGDSSNYQNRIVAAYIIDIVSGGGEVGGEYTATLKIWKRKGNKVELRPANPNYKTQIYSPKSKKELRAFGVVFKVLRNYVYSKPFIESIAEVEDEMLVVR
jgi:SOS-response transcriptional repressor LexA